MPSALPAPSATSAEEWDFLQLNVLKPSRSSSVCMTCQHFRYEVGRHCVTLLTCPIHQGLIPQGEHLTKRCSGWVARRELAVGGVLRRGEFFGVEGEFKVPSNDPNKTRSHLPLTFR